MLNPDEFRTETEFPYEGYEKQSSIRDEGLMLDRGTVEVPQTNATLGDLKLGEKLKENPSWFQKLTTPTIEGNAASTPLGSALGSLAMIFPEGREIIPKLNQQASNASKLKMEQDQHELTQQKKVTETLDYWAKQPSSPLRTNMMRGLLGKLGNTY